MKTENSKSFDASVPQKFSRNGKVYNLQKTSNNLNPGSWISLEISVCTYSIHQPPFSKSFAERKHKYEEKHSSIHHPQCSASFDSWNPKESSLEASQSEHQEKSGWPVQRKPQSALRTVKDKSPVKTECSELRKQSTFGQQN